MRSQPYRIGTLAFAMFLGFILAVLMFSTIGEQVDRQRQLQNLNVPADQEPASAPDETV